MSEIHLFTHSLFARVVKGWHLRCHGLIVRAGSIPAASTLDNFSHNLLVGVVWKT